MCFSSEASFGASIVLGTIGVVAVSKVKKPSQIPFAVIPLMFAVQQASEGMLWIGLSDPNHESWRHWPVYFFLVFAQVIWPVWIPFSVLLLERKQLRKKILTIFLFIGLLISSYLLYCLFVYEVSAEVRSGHIRYNLYFPESLVWISGIFYFIPIGFSPLVSSVKGMTVLGLATLLSFVITEIFLEDHLISVWCFFAAILSIMVLGIVWGINKNKPEFNDTVS